MPRSGSPLALPLKPDTACFSASKSLFMVQNSSVLYFCSPLSHCSVNVNVFKYSSQIPFVKNKTCYILAFICYIKLSYGIKQNLKDKEILRGLVFSSDCWLWSLSPQHYSETYIACHVRSFEMHPQAISHKRSKHSKRSVFIEACNRPSYAVTFQVYIVRPIYWLYVDPQ